MMRLNRHKPISPKFMVFYIFTTKLDDVFQLDLSTIEDKILSGVSLDNFGFNVS
jgi:hypothetical protein